MPSAAKREATGDLNGFCRHARYGIRAGIPDAEYSPNSLLPHFPGESAGPLLEPNRQVFEGRTRLCLDGLAVDLMTVPTETGNRMKVFLPESRVLFSGVAVYGAFTKPLYPARSRALRRRHRARARRDAQGHEPGPRAGQTCLHGAPARGNCRRKALASSTAPCPGPCGNHRCHNGLV